MQDVNQHVHRPQTIAANLLLVQQLNQPTITKFSKTFLFPHDFILFHSNIHPENVFISKSLEPIWGVYSGARSILRFYVWLMLTSSEFISGLEDTYFICSLKMFWGFRPCGEFNATFRPPKTTASDFVHSALDSKFSCGQTNS